MQNNSDDTYNGRKIKDFVNTVDYENPNLMVPFVRQSIYSSKNEKLGEAHILGPIKA